MLIAIGSAMGAPYRHMGGTVLVVDCSDGTLRQCAEDARIEVGTPLAHNTDTGVVEPAEAQHISTLRVGERVTLGEWGECEVVKRYDDGRVVAVTAEGHRIIGTPDAPDQFATTPHAAGRAMGALMPAIGEAACSEGAKGGAIAGHGSALRRAGFGAKSLPATEQRAVDAWLARNPRGTATTDAAGRTVLTIPPMTDAEIREHLAEEERAVHPMMVCPEDYDRAPTLTCDEDGTERIRGVPTGRVLRNGIPVAPNMRCTIPEYDAPPPRCPSCDSTRHMRKTDHGLHFCACGWHGASLTPVVAPRFAVGDWVHDLAYGDIGQVMFVSVPTHAVCGVFYGMAVSDDDGEHRSHAHLETDLVPAERPR